MVTDIYGTSFEWQQTNVAAKRGFTAWSPVNNKSGYFGDFSQQYLINNRIENPEALVETLKNEGVKIVDVIEIFEYGKFIHILDVEGNREELWEANDGAMKNTECCNQMRKKWIKKETVEVILLTGLKTNMPKLIILLFFSCFFSMANAQKGILPCGSPEYRQFDFWIGEWEAFNPNGQKGGDSKISLMLDSCIILEEWTSTSVQQGLRYAGKSFNTYNATTKQWQQTWVDNVGGTNEYMQGKFENNQIIFSSTPFKFNKDTMAIRKMTFTNINADKLRQHGEISKDNGLTWSTEYDLEYRRKTDKVTAIVDSILRGMEDGYNKADYEKITSYYSVNGKVVGRTTEISGQKNILAYWKDFKRLGGIWKLTNERSEKIGDQIWQKGVSVITDKAGKEHKVNFTLIFIQESGNWKILQDAYW